MSEDSDPEKVALELSDPPFPLKWMLGVEHRLTQLESRQVKEILLLIGTLATTVITLYKILHGG